MSVWTIDDKFKAAVEQSIHEPLEEALRAVKMAAYNDSFLPVRFRAQILRVAFAFEELELLVERMHRERAE